MTQEEFFGSGAVFSMCVVVLLSLFNWKELKKITDTEEDEDFGAIEGIMTVGIALSIFLSWGALVFIIIGWFQFKKDFKRDWEKK